MSQLTDEASKKYKRIEQLSIGPYAIHIQAQHDVDNQWLTTQFKLADEDLDAIIDEWPLECKVTLSDEELSDIENGPPPDIMIEKYQLKES